MKNTLYIVGIGPGGYEDMTVRADECLKKVQVIAGYDLYLSLVRDRYPDKEYISTPMKEEAQRCRLALEEVSRGRSVAMICSGDPQVYGMASLVYELLDEYPDTQAVVIPGITAALCGSALLGAVINNDFCVISLSDYLTPKEEIEKRLRNAADSDMVIVLYNPRSHKRPDALSRACDILLEVLEPDRLCGIVRNAGRQGQETAVMTLKQLRDHEADMFTTVFIGNSKSCLAGGRLITPRGYKL